ncbi:MAG: hypothetical protein HZC37_28820 [Burkholderiales bacterium]|nr:hypothetical protein [Burkholderiales bacterium]
MPKIGHFVLHSNFLPQITAGRYELKTEQSGLPFTVAAETTHVHVAAPRFTMPTDQILSSFPPANAEGAFGDRLPQIVLKRRTLPWERNPSGATTPDANKPWLALVVVAEGEAELSTAVPVAECVTPGTQLLDSSDKDVEQGLYLGVTETVVKKIFPTEADLALLVHVREVDIRDTELANGDDDGWLAVVLANRLPVFDSAGNKPVRYMACLVNVEGQLPSLPKPAPAFDHFEWVLAQDWSGLAAVAYESGDAVVMGGAPLTGVTLPAQALGRAPRSGAAAKTARASSRAAAAPPASTLAGKAIKPLAAGTFDGTRNLVQPAAADQWRQTTAHVAAAARDPDAKRLVRDTMGLGFRYPIGRYAVERVLRFPVLAHWSFTTSEGATFETLMQDLDVGLLGTLPVAPPAEPGKPLPAPRPVQAPPEVVETGHLSLAHRARRGDALRAWYRGPCVPFATPRDGSGGSAGDDAEAPLALAHAADQLKRVIPDGREDLTLAAAFEIGRLLALSQLSVVSALLRFRAEQFGAGRVREILSEALPYDLPELVANAGEQRVDLGRFVAVQVIDELAKTPEHKLGPRRPVADPGRALKVEGDLDRLIATGLGLDLDALRRRGDQVGLVAALEEVAVPVAGRLGDGKVGARDVLALRAALQGELQRTLDIAAPPKVGRPPVLRSGRGARARGAAGAAMPGEGDAVDALDALIAGAARRAADQAGAEAGDEGADDATDEGEDDQESPR